MPSEIPTGIHDDVSAMYVIMLDRYLSEYPDEYPISGMSDDPTTLEQQAQHDGHPARVSKHLHKMTDEWDFDSTHQAIIHKVTLENMITGDTDCGKIYAVLA